jgi:hypothetical protein
MYMKACKDVDMEKYFEFFFNIKYTSIFFMDKIF